MADLVVLSSTGLAYTHRYRNLTYDPSRGWKTEDGFEGTPEALESILPTIAIDQHIHLDTRSAPDCTLTVTTPDLIGIGDGTSEEIVTTFELLGSRLEKRIYGHPTCDALGEVAVANLQNCVDARSPAAAPNASPKRTALSGTALQFYDLIIKGTDSFRVSNYVFKMTQLVSNRYINKVAFNNVGKVYTTASLKAETNPPGTIIFSLDSVAADPPSFDSSTHAYGWLKDTPTINQVAGNRFAATFEYTLEAWSTLLYGAAI